MVLSYRPGVQVSMTFEKVGAAEGSACREMTEHDGPGAKRWVAWGCGVLLACSVRGKQEELGPSVATQQEVQTCAMYQLWDVWKERGEGPCCWGQTLCRGGRARVGSPGGEGWCATPSTTSREGLDSPATHHETGWD